MIRCSSQSSAFVCQAVATWLLYCLATWHRRRAKSPPFRTPERVNGTPRSPGSPCSMVMRPQNDNRGSSHSSHSSSGHRHASAMLQKTCRNARGSSPSTIWWNITTGGAAAVRWGRQTEQSSTPTLSFGSQTVAIDLDPLTPAPGSWRPSLPASLPVLPLAALIEVLYVLFAAFSKITLCSFPADVFLAQPSPLVPDRH